MKLDKLGTPVWARSIGNAPSGTFNTFGCGISDAAIAVDGDVIIAGGFRQPIDFGDGSPQTNGNTGYVAKLSSATGIGSGNMNGAQWAQFFEGAEQPRLAVDGMGNIYVGATLAGTTWWPGDVMTTMVTGADLAVATYDPMGNPGLSQRFSNGMTQKLDALAVSPFGDVVLAGQLQGTVAFFGSSLSATSAQGDGFAVQLNQVSSVLTYTWGTTFGTNGEALGAGLDTDGNVRLLGWFTGTLDLGGSPLSAAGNQMMLLAELAPTDGSVKWNRGWIYPAPVSASFAVAPAGDSFVDGTLQHGPFDLGTGPLIQPTDSPTAWAGRFAP